MYAKVAVDIIHRQLDQLFDYEIPQGLPVRVGSKVVVPFRNRVVDGYVFAVSDSTDVRNVRKLALPKAGEVVAPEHSMELALWIAESTLCTLQEAARLMFPPGNIPLAPGLEPAARLLSDPPAVRQALRRSPVRLRLLDCVLSGWDGKPVPVAEALKAATASEAAAASLVKDGILVRTFLTRKPSMELKATPVKEVMLNEAQSRAVAEITRAMGEGRGVLLHGVTGSGKTEVYVRSLKAAMATGRKGILLVPDIALTPQISDIMRGHFGDRVAVLHSGLTDSERSYHWYMAMKGEVDVVVGARSAIFAPLPDIGVIIVDEEHDSSYKQEESPRYHARDVAERKARLTGAALVLGSATPSLESYSRAISGELALCALPERVDGKAMPRMELVDRREEIKASNFSFMSRRLRSETEAALARGERVMLFLNRRGHSPLILCRDCGYTMKCPDCDVSLVYHSDGKIAKCHYCSHEEKVPPKCPRCKSARFKLYGVGTQKVEEELAAIFPGVGIARMDVDSTRKRGSHRRILEDFKSGKAPVLVGTQMIAKGLDIPEVTLVGVIAADMSLKFPDFRSAERTFQLVTQVAGRAGRGDGAGLVIVQAYNPEHYSLKAAVDNDYAGFFRREAASRKALGYPPCSSMARVLVSDESSEKARLAATKMAEGIRAADGSVRVLGPTEAPLARVEGRARWHILLLSEDGTALRKALSPYAKGVQDADGPRVRIDIDPQSTL